MSSIDSIESDRESKSSSEKGRRTVWANDDGNFQKAFE